MAKLKEINFSLIVRDAEPEPYAVLDEMLKFHRDISGARVALAWRVNLTEDKDGHLVLGKCVKITDMHKELADWDFMILLNGETWETFSLDQKRALVDHELCHAAPALDDKFKQQHDERGRPVWRIRKHDIEEFQDVVKRHGCYKSDLARFAKELLNKRQAPLLSVLDSDVDNTTVEVRNVQ